MATPTSFPSDPSFLSSFLGDNPYFSAGFGLMGVGVGLTALKRGVTLANVALQRRLLVSLEIPNKDRSYDWFLAWMARQTQSAPATRSSSWVRSHQLSVETHCEQHGNGNSSVSFNLVAGPGTHYFKYKGAWMQIKREREQKMMNMQMGVPWETVTLTTLSRDRHLFPQLLSEARDLAMSGKEGRIVINTAWGIEWRPFGQPRLKRDLSSVVLEEGVRERIEGDLKAFLSRRQWYAQRGIPYRRGYLLHGPPGSGKSSFIQALAGSLSYDICILNLSERGLGDDKLNHLLSNVPERCFILIEDVDAAFNKRVQTSEDGYQSSVTFSGFLNALDGVASGEERIIFLTTNHLERLDPALIRPGRVDLLECLDDASPPQAKRLFLRFYGDDSAAYTDKVSSSEVQQMADELERLVEMEQKVGRKVSMASLQGHFIRNGAREALNTTPTLFTPRTQMHS